ncbi:L,D-transpeptidase family protein [Microbacterium sp. YMB-B2]|uniref:L,D-transpeptidase family protein n=1 Tax=Microbacterium tenebrionis TaxID=2830665 RepID=A0A9X1LPI9_9MICO|nr:L,D-transpeptidase family protein [Microbacterium tenebrionis]MCC2029569.1 L,D-transpeptidase family protein [Microbacterium tenebrionis]
MTDLAAAPGAADSTASTEVLPPIDGERPVEWAPHEPAPKKHRTGLWVGLGVGALLVSAAAAASLILIAPGTTIAGVAVGGLTPAAAAEAVENHLAATQISLTDGGADVVVSASELGASIDAKSLADTAFAEHPMWNLGAWLPEPIAGEIVLDPEVAHDTLRGLVPSAYEDAIDAGVSFDAASNTYATTPAVAGTGIDLDALTGAISGALADGAEAVSYSSAPAEAPAAISDADATAVADQLNGMLKTIGFYVGDERTVPVDPAVAATWIDVVDADGQLEITADATEIQKTVATLAEQVDRAPVDAKAIVNGSGTVLQELTAGVTGRTLGDTSTLAADFATRLEAGEAVQPIEVDEVAFKEQTLLRQIDVNLSTQRVSAIENGVVVDSWSVSSGTTGYSTHTGSYSVGWKTSSQNMGNRDLTKAPYYFQPDVKWVMYFNGDQALHGVYWHANWGTPMSHGCVGMPEWRAQWLYNWTPQGVGVNVHY